MAELDRQLATAIAALPNINKKVAVQHARLANQQELLALMKQHISELVSLQRELNGGGPHTIMPSFQGSSATVGAASYNPQAPIPPGVTSIPTKREPKAGPGNAAEKVAHEGGFS